ncbi:MAG: RNA methyltransferase [Bdellovibrionales bacterium]|nr:RNA methyltransferase [Bdellovibrionales bacterium]
MKVISSKANSNYRRWKDLLKGPDLKKSSEFLIIGRKLVPEFLNRHPECISGILLTSPEQRELLPIASPCTLFLLEKELFRQIDIFSTQFPILVARQPAIANWDPNLPPHGLEVFSALGDPSNLGALLRCCEAFKVGKVILLQESTHPFHPKAVRSSAGSCFRLNLEWGPSIQQDLGDFFALDNSGRSLTEFSWPQSGRLLFGEEGNGLPPNKRGSLCLKIPMSENLESLNAVSAASIALFHYRLQHPLD